MAAFSVLAAVDKPLPLIPAMRPGHTTW